MIGLGRAAPVFAGRDLAAAMRFYERLGFAIRRHDAGYGYAEREGLRIHLRASPELREPGHAEVFVDARDVDRLHEEWRACGLLPVQGGIVAELAAEVRRRWEAGEPVGLLSERVEDKPWGVREFALRDLDNNQIRFGRPT